MRAVLKCLLETRIASAPVMNGDYCLAVETRGAFTPCLPLLAMNGFTLVHNFFWL